MCEKEEEMGGEISNLVRPRSIIIFLIGSVFVFLAFSSSSQLEEDAVEEVHEITHRVFLDVDIDKQRLGRIVIGLYGEIVPKTVEEHDYRLIVFKSNLRRPKRHELLDPTTEHGVTKFSDLTALEFRERYLGLKSRLSFPSDANKAPILPTDDNPEDFDWHDQNLC